MQSGPAVANGLLYVGSWDGNLYALDGSTGAPLWSYTTGGSVISSPTVTNGVVYVGSGFKVYAFGLARGAPKDRAGFKRPGMKALHPDESLKAEQSARNAVERTLSLRG